MCRRPTTSCIELGINPENWSSRSPLIPKSWFDRSMDAFEQAYRAALTGDTRTALVYLAGTNDRELNEWFDVHAQNTGTFRNAHYGREPMPAEDIALDPLRQVTRFEKELFVRDGYRCRCCGVRVLPSSVTKRMQELVTPTFFGATVRGNRARHGIKLAFSAALDHVVPHSRGGRTNSDNLVTACWGCNYGKAEYTLAELGLDDPRGFEPIVDGWQGLTDALVCSGCGSGHNPQWIAPHRAGGYWHEDFCMPPADWSGPGGHSR